MSTPLKILLVDDSERCVDLMTCAFAGLPVVIASETDPEEGLRRIQSERPDLVILDLKMPRLDGISLLVSLRSRGDRVPVVICSGSSVQTDIIRAYAAGCNGYFVKPTSLQEYQHLAKAIAAFWTRAILPLAVESDD